MPPIRPVIFSARSKIRITQPALADAFYPLLTQHLSQSSLYHAKAQEFSSMIGHPAPDFTAVDLNGQSHTLHDLRGKVIVLDFWNRSCPPCMAELPSLIQSAIQYQKDPVTFVGMFTTSDLKNARAVDSQFHFPYPILDASKSARHLPRHSLAHSYRDRSKRNRSSRTQIGGSPNIQTDLAPIIDRLLKAQ